MTNPTGTAGDGFGDAIAVNGSVDGDAFDDIVISAKYAATTTSGSTGHVYVYFGGPALGSVTSCPTPATATSTCQDITIPVAQHVRQDDNFGAQVAVGNIGDSPAADIVVSSLTANSYAGRAFIFFGGARPIDTTSFVEIDGPTNGFFFGQAYILAGSRRRRHQ